MSEAPVDAIREAVEALNRGDADAYVSAFAPSCLRTVPGVVDPLHLDEIEDGLRGLAQAFEGVRLDPLVLFGDGRYVSARWLMTGVHTGEYLGVPATGRPVSVETCEVYEFDGGRVTASWAFGDALELPRQLGLLADSDRQA
jgi:steroid delta-isomerase-like uncharacterized protein